jgi:phosphotransferase system enzyme I (PtsI)
MAGDPHAIPLLLGLGVDELSMSASRIPRIKRLIREWSLREAQAIAAKALDLDSAESVRQLIRS